MRCVSTKVRLLLKVNVTLFSRSTTYTETAVDCSFPAVKIQINEKKQTKWLTRDFWILFTFIRGGDVESEETLHLVLNVEIEQHLTRFCFDGERSG